MSSESELLQTVVQSQRVARLARLRRRLDEIDFQDLSVRGWDKFLEADFLYERRHVEPPAQLYFLGRDWQILNSAISVSFGGTVSPVADGVQMATMLAQATVDNALGLDALVVGGGVLGVDTAAHLGALDKAGKTVAVLANAVRHGLHPYSPRRSFLQSAILNHQGALVAEHDDLVITKGSALEIPQNTGDTWIRAARDFKGRALGYETGGAPSVPVCIDRRGSLHQSSRG